MSHPRQVLLRTCVGAMSGVAALYPTLASAQSIIFARSTDTIAFDTDCLPEPNAATLELRFRFSGAQPSGQFYNQHRSFSFDRQLGIYNGGVYEYSHPIDSGFAWEVPAVLAPDEWHHLAFCYDGAMESMYLDDSLLASRPRTGVIEPSCGSTPPGGVAGLGWVRRTDGGANSAAPVTMDYFRSSSIARYTGMTYSPPTDPIAPDADTLLLYSFDECEASEIVHDLGPLHRLGTLGGVLGAGGTSPLLTGPVYANCDRSTTPPVLNVNDFICFQSKFAAGDSTANCDHSTTPPVLNVNDFICFQTRFAEGC